MRIAIALAATVAAICASLPSTASAAYRCGYWTEYRNGAIINVIGPPCGGNGWQHGSHGRIWGAPVYGSPVIVGPTVTIPGRLIYSFDRGPNDYLARDAYGNVVCVPGGSE